MSSHGFERPNLLGRIYLQLADIGVAAQIYYVLDVAGRIDPVALRHALAALLDDIPQLRSRAVGHWYGYRRALVPLAEMDLDTLLTVSSAAGAPDAFLQQNWNLEREPPFHVLLHQTPTHDQLLIAMHHSIADGHALLSVVTRLGEYYESALTGERLSSAERRTEVEARYRELLQRLPWPDRWHAFQRAWSYLWHAAALPGSGKTLGVATFTDQRLPARGQLRYMRIGVSFDRVTRLMRWAVKRNGSPTDVLLTASLRAALRVWPDEAHLPIMVSLPVSVRSPADAEIANRVAVMDFPVHAGEFDAMFAQISRATAEARTRGPAVVNMFKFAIASYLPPAAFAYVARRYLSQSVNVRESLTFTALGVFDGGPQRFGPAAVTDSVFLGSVLAPPGLKVHVSPHGGRLNLCVAYLDPVIAPASIAAFAAAISAELDSLA